MPITHTTPFVPPGYGNIFSLGFARMLQGDYVSAAHILFPQLENSLRHMLVLGNADPTKVEADLLQGDRALGALRCGVDRLGHDFLADAAFALDQHGHAGTRRLCGDGERGAEHRLGPDDLVKAERGGNLFGQRAQFASRLHYKMFGGTHLVNRAGLARTFQNIRLFKEMSVVENLLVAQHMWVNRNLLAGVFNTPGFRKSEDDALNHAFYWLEVVDLVDCANRLAGELSYGQQRRLEIARCMMTRPQILMLDEPAAGLNPRETEDLKALIAMLRAEHGVTVLLIEHDMKLVMSISDHIYVINQGTPLADGTPEQIRDNPDVIKAYLGEA